MRLWGFIDHLGSCSTGSSERLRRSGTGPILEMRQRKNVQDLMTG